MRAGRHGGTMVQNNQVSRWKYWAIFRPFACLLVSLFACTSYSFACSALLTLLVRSAALIHSLAHSQAVFSILDHSGRVRAGGSTRKAGRFVTEGGSIARWFRGFMVQHITRAQEWVSERASERLSSAREWVSGAREQTKGQASGPGLTPRFLVILAHSVRVVQLLGGSEGGGCISCLG